METKDLVRWIRKLISINKIVLFYKNKHWKNLRQEVLGEQRDECQMCKGKGLFEPATMVHHIKHVKQHPELALTKSNLMSLCDECHYLEHHTIEHRQQLNEEKW